MPSAADTKEKEKLYTSYEEFYPFYLTQHRLPTTKLFHFIGTTIALGFLTIFLRGIVFDKIGAQWSLIGMGLFCAYFCAWVSHFFIEKNKPATFTYPFWSFRGDLQMWSEICRGMHKIF